MILRGRSAVNAKTGDTVAQTSSTDAGPPRTRKAQGKSGGTTIYPHLSLGPSQRFASKGGYIARFAGMDGGRLVADSGWIVP